jgi:hypothetical protein
MHCQSGAQLHEYAKVSSNPIVDFNGNLDLF